MNFKIQCKYCKKEFKVIESRLNRAKFCSIKCKAEFQKGKKQGIKFCKKRSETAKRNYKLGLNNIGWSKGLTKEISEVIAKMLKCNA